MTDIPFQLAESVPARFAARPEVVAVAQAGSRVAAPAIGFAIAPDGDIDL
jgi:hypothetical protein